MIDQDPPRQPQPQPRQPLGPASHGCRQGSGVETAVCLRPRFLFSPRVEARDLLYGCRTQTTTADLLVAIRCRDLPELPLEETEALGGSDATQVGQISSKFLRSIIHGGVFDTRPWRSVDVLWEERPGALRFSAVNKRRLGPGPIRSHRRGPFPWLGLFASRRTGASLAPPPSTTRWSPGQCHATGVRL